MPLADQAIPSRSCPACPPQASRSMISTIRTSSRLRHCSSERILRAEREDSDINRSPKDGCLGIMELEHDAMPQVAQTRCDDHANHGSEPRRTRTPSTRHGRVVRGNSVVSVSPSSFRARRRQRLGAVRLPTITEQSSISSLCSSVLSLPVSFRLRSSQRFSNSLLPATAVDSMPSPLSSHIVVRCSEHRLASTNQSDAEQPPVSQGSKIIRPSPLQQSVEQRALQQSYLSHAVGSPCSISRERQDETHWRQAKTKRLRSVLGKWIHVKPGACSYSSRTAARRLRTTAEAPNEATTPRGRGSPEGDTRRMAIYELNQGRSESPICATHQAMTEAIPKTRQRDDGKDSTQRMFGREAAASWENLISSFPAPPIRTIENGSVPTKTTFGRFSPVNPSFRDADSAEQASNSRKLDEQLASPDHIASCRGIQAPNPAAEPTTSSANHAKAAACECDQIRMRAAGSKSFPSDATPEFDAAACARPLSPRPDGSVVQGNQPEEPQAYSKPGVRPSSRKATVGLSQMQLFDSSSTVCWQSKLSENRTPNQDDQPANPTGNSLSSSRADSTATKIGAFRVELENEENLHQLEESCDAVKGCRRSVRRDLKQSQHHTSLDITDPQLAAGFTCERSRTSENLDPKAKATEFRHRQEGNAFGRPRSTSSAPHDVRVSANSDYRTYRVESAALSILLPLAASAGIVRPCSFRPLSPEVVSFRTKSDALRSRCRSLTALPTTIKRQNRVALPAGILRISGNTACMRSPPETSPHPSELPSDQFSEKSTIDTGKSSRADEEGDRNIEVVCTQPTSTQCDIIYSPILNALPEESEPLAKKQSQGRRRDSVIWCTENEENSETSISKQALHGTGMALKIKTQEENKCNEPDCSQADVSRSSTVYADENGDFVSSLSSVERAAPRKIPLIQEQSTCGGVPTRHFSSPQYTPQYSFTEHSPLLVADRFSITPSRNSSRRSDGLGARISALMRACFCQPIGGIIDDEDDDDEDDGVCEMELDNEYGDAAVGSERRCWENNARAMVL